MACPLYKSLKPNGTSFYAFPGAAEDISAQFQNQNYKMYFDKYILLNLPKQNLDSGTNSNPVVFDFANSLYRMNNVGQQATTFNDEIIESLRNYVANEEVTIRGSRLNNTEYYYDSTSLQTTTEKIFWKWAKELNLIDFEPAVDGTQYFGNLNEFQRGNLNDDTYFPEILWQERTTNPYNTINFYQSNVSGATYSYLTNLEVEFSSLTNFRVGDTIIFDGISNLNMAYLNGVKGQIVYIIPPDSMNNQRAVLNLTYIGSIWSETTGTAKLVYNKLVQYIGEIQGVNNVQQSNRSYTQVYAYVADNTGQTPDILFRTLADVNYKPGMYYPILPSQYQPEIVGAELFNSPIVNTPQDYPGNYYAQFDNNDYTYQTANGDTLRRSGDYYGVNGDITNPSINGSTIDGIGIDFSTNHYVKMNIIGQELTTFEEFNALVINNTPPKDFEFNAILWYYSVEDVNGNSATNLYGISFLDNPNNNPIESEVGLKFPTYKKLAANDNQDGTSYAFSLNLNFNIIYENTQDSYNQSAASSVYSFSLFNKAMSELTVLNDSFNKIIGQQANMQLQINDLTGLVYTQTDFDKINAKIANLEELLKLYQYTQLVSSDTIQVVQDTTTNPPYVKLNNIDLQYGQIENVLTTDLYNSQGIIPMDIAVPMNKNFLTRVLNNDVTILNLPNNDKLTMYLDRDLDYMQSYDISIDSDLFATQNKQLEVYVNYSNGKSNSLPVLTQILPVIDFPIYHNSYTQTNNTSYNWSRFDYDVDLTKNISLSLNYTLSLPLTGVTQQIFNNSIKKGDTYLIKDFIIGTSSTIDFSGQYTVSSVETTSLYVNFDMSSNSKVRTFANTNITNGVSVNLNPFLVSKPYVDLNKGVNYRITRINAGATSSISERYLIQRY